MPEIRHLKDLTLDPENARKHSSRGLGMLVDTLHQVGAARSIVIDEEGVVLAGNLTVEAAAEAGIERVKVVEADGNELVAVRRTGLTYEQKKQLALRDNRVGEMSEWDPEELNRLVQEGAVDLDGLFFPEELDAVLKTPPYTPNLEPETGSSLVTEQDLEKARQDLREQFQRQLSTQRVLCPHCGGEFYLDAQAVQDALGGDAGPTDAL
mgnify:CR=1 FL=1